MTIDFKTVKSGTNALARSNPSNRYKFWRGDPWPQNEPPELDARAIAGFHDKAVCKVEFLVKALYDIQSMRAFAGLELGHDAIPDETTILNFRRLLEAHDLTKAIFEAVSAHLADKWCLQKDG